MVLVGLFIPSQCVVGGNESLGQACEGCEVDECGNRDPNLNGGSCSLNSTDFCYLQPAGSPSLCASSCPVFYAPNSTASCQLVLCSHRKADPSGLGDFPRCGPGACYFYVERNTAHCTTQCPADREVSQDLMACVKESSYAIPIIVIFATVVLASVVAIISLICHAVGEIRSSKVKDLDQAENGLPRTVPYAGSAVPFQVRMVRAAAATWHNNPPPPSSTATKSSPTGTPLAGSEVGQKKTVSTQKSKSVPDSKTSPERVSAKEKKKGGSEVKGGAESAFTSSYEPSSPLPPQIKNGDKRKPGKSPGKAAAAPKKKKSVGKSVRG